MGDHGAVWHVKCDCGDELLARADGLKKGKIKSCGCYGRDKTKERLTTHGMTGTPTHRCWIHMLSRCNSPTATGYKNYGGRGIKVCKRWQQFENFLADMGEQPKDHTIERIDNSKGYGPKNCRWATRAEQALNRRSNRILTHNGKSMPIVLWAKKLGLLPVTISRRLHNGWTVAEALDTPWGCVRGTNEMNPVHAARSDA